MRNRLLIIALALCLLGSSHSSLLEQDATQCLRNAIFNLIGKNKGISNISEKAIKKCIPQLVAWQTSLEGQTLDQAIWDVRKLTRDLILEYRKK